MIPLLKDVTFPHTDAVPDAVPDPALLYGIVGRDDESFVCRWVGG